MSQCGKAEHIGGRVKKFKAAWCDITSDQTILQMANGLKLEFLAELPQQQRIPFPIKLNPIETAAVNLEIEKLENKGVIEQCDHEDGEFISNIFTRPKKDGGLRRIQNLRQLNEGLEYHHFKMDTFMSAIHMVTPNCFMASIDLRDAYYSVPIALDHQKYLKFIWGDSLYKFKALPNGLTSGPRMFTKLMKPPFATLRKKGYIIVGYIDDTLLLGETKEQVVQAVRDTVALLRRLGFLIIIIIIKCFI